MKIWKIVLSLFCVAFYFSGHGLAAVYQDGEDHFQMNVPDQWIVLTRISPSGKVLILKHPTLTGTSIIMKTADNPGAAPDQTLNNYSQEEIHDLMESMKTEIAQNVSQVHFESATTRYYAHNKTIQLNYSDGSSEYCLTEFLGGGKIYMLIFSTSKAEYPHIAPTFFNMLNSFQAFEQPADSADLKNSVPLL